MACVESAVYLRKRGRVVECTGLENRRWATIREFESHRFRHLSVSEHPKKHHNPLFSIGKNKKGCFTRYHFPSLNRKLYGGWDGG